MSNRAPAILSAVTVAAMIAGWVAITVDTGASKTAEAQRAAQGEACAHEEGFGAGLANYLPSNEAKAAPQTVFRDGDGNPVSLADFRGQGLVVNFWATWCAPCVAEMPALDRLNADLSDDGITVLAISEDRNPETVVPAFYERVGLETLGIYADEGMKLAREAAVSGLPTTLLINPAGDEVAAVLGPAEWDEPEIAEFLKNCLLHQG